MPEQEIPHHEVQGRLFVRYRGSRDISSGSPGLSASPIFRVGCRSSQEGDPATDSEIRNAGPPPVTGGGAERGDEWPKHERRTQSPGAAKRQNPELQEW